MNYDEFTPGRKVCKISDQDFIWEIMSLDLFANCLDVKRVYLEGQTGRYGDTGWIGLTNFFDKYKFVDTVPAVEPQLKCECGQNNESWVKHSWYCPLYKKGV